MKKIAILIAVVLVLVVAVFVWAQRQPDNLQPSSSFYGTVTYHGCICNQDDHVYFRPEGSTVRYEYRLQRCGGVPGYTTVAQVPEKLIQGWYYAGVVIPTHNGCQTNSEVRVWHSGAAPQEVNLDVYQ